MKNNLAGYLTLIAAGVLAGFFGYRWYAARATVALAGMHATAQTAGGPASTAAGSPMASAADDQPRAPDRRVPRELPALRLPDLAGKPHSLRDYRGRPLLLNFWATWCEPCRREIPLLNALPKRYAADRLQVVGIAIDQPDAVRDYVRHLPISYPLLVGEDQGLEAAASFGMEPVLPFSVFVDASGQVLAVKIGELHADDADAILKSLRALGAGTIAFPAARQQIDEGLKELAARRALSRR